MLQELKDENENQGLKMNNSKTKVMMEKDTQIYINNTLIENVESYLRLPGTEIQHQRQKRRQGDSRQNHGWMGSIRQAPRHLQGYHWNLLEERSLHLMHTSSNDI